MRVVPLSHTAPLPAVSHRVRMLPAAVHQPVRWHWHSHLASNPKCTGALARHPHPHAPRTRSNTRLSPGRTVTVTLSTCAAAPAPAHALAEVLPGLRRLTIGDRGACVRAAAASTTALAGRARPPAVRAIMPRTVHAHVRPAALTPLASPTLFTPDSLVSRAGLQCRSRADVSRRGMMMLVAAASGTANTAGVPPPPVGPATSNKPPAMAPQKMPGMAAPGQPDGVMSQRMQVRTHESILCPTVCMRWGGFQCVGTPRARRVAWPYDVVGH
jgi:hypothetical protein